MSRVPDLVLDLAKAVREHGGRALLVGGFVRDRLLGRESKDFDLEVFGVGAAELRPLVAQFGRVDLVGESFGVLKIGAVDIALPRRESKRGHGHRGFLVEGDPALSYREAARRRDFTINAISEDPLTGEVIDPFDGARDVAARVLRMVDGRTFGEDSLRVLRALQFAARFELTIDRDTAEVCRHLVLADLPAERVWGEVEKLLLLPKRPSIGLALGWDLGVIHQCLPELVPLAACPQDPEWHPEGDVWTHTLMVVDQARTRLEGLDRGRSVAIMLGALCHDIAKPETTAMIDGRWRSPGHEEAGVEPTGRVLDRLNVHTIDGYDVRRTVLGLVAQHLKPSAFHKSPPKDGAFRRLAQKVDLELLTRLATADCHGRGGAFDCSAMDWFVERARSLGVEHKEPEPILYGRHLIELGMTPGPEMGRVLKAVYERQLDGTVTTLDAAIMAAKQYRESFPI